MSDQDSATADSAPARRRWPQVVFIVAMTVMAVDLAAGFVVKARTGQFPLSIVLGVFLICFALLKLTVAVDAINRLAHRGGGPDPVAHHGSRGMTWGWIIYKLAAAFVALAAAVFFLTVGADKMNGFIEKTPDPQTETKTGE